MAGRNKQPLTVIQGKGKSNHLTKEEIQKREQLEEKMRGPTDDIQPPSYLTAAQKKEFNDTARKLIALNIFSELDVDNLARYLDSKFQYVQLVKDLRKIKPTMTIEDEDGNKHIVANENYPKLMRSKKNLFEECRAAASDLGLSITSRLKLVIPDVGPPVHTQSDFERKFGDV